MVVKKMEISIPINTIIISIFIGYMYHYLKSDCYMDVISFKSLILGVIAGFLIIFITLILTLINTPFFNISYIPIYYILIIETIGLSIVLVVVGGLLAIPIKNFIISYKQKRS